MKKIIFMGTPSFAVDALTALVESNEYEIVAVVTQPDKPVGRKRTLTPPDVKVKAEELGLKLMQPKNISDSASVESLLELEADLIVTAAYGQILPKPLLDHPKYGAINIHASLLPQYRGAAPIHYAVLNGDSKTGISIMHMEEGLDSGDVLSQAELEIEESDDTGSLFVKLADLGQELLLQTLPNLFSGDLQAQPQDEALATYAPSITQEQEQINWLKSASFIHQQIKALRPEPGAFTFLAGDRFKIWSAEVSEQETSLQPGQVCRVEKKYFYVACGESSVLKIKEVQPAGKKRMPVASFLNGAGQFIEEGYRFDDC